MSRLFQYIASSWGLLFLLTFSPAAVASPASVATAPARPMLSAPTSSATASAPRSSQEQQSTISYLAQVISWYRNLATEASLAQEPAEGLYLADDQGLAGEITKLAFSYGRAMAALLADNSTASGLAPAVTAQQSSIPTVLAKAKAEQSSLQATADDLANRLRTAPARQKTDLAQQLAGTRAQLELAKVKVSYISTMAAFEASAQSPQHDSGLQGQVDELERSVTAAQVRPPAESGDKNPEPTGPLGLATHLVQEQRKAGLLSDRSDSTQALANSLERLRTPLIQSLGKIDAQARQLAQQPVANDRNAMEQRKKDFDILIARRRFVDEALLPLSKQRVLLRRYAANLAGWRKMLQDHSSVLLRSLLVKIGSLLFLAGIICGLAIVWRRLTERYIDDVHRRRQVLKIRDISIVFLCIILVLFNFTTELSALATVLGFAAAGIAVALQEVILSIAGYFRLSGRFGIKHGDRVELNGVRGEVLDVGLTKLTLIELGANSPQSGPTGRLVVIPNSSVFHEKFVNHPRDTSIIWCELRFTLSPDCDYRLIEKRLLEVVEDVFARYRDSARKQLAALERNLNTRIDSARPQSRLRLAPTGLEITLRYPVEARGEAQFADEISRRLMDFIARDSSLRFVPSASPNIQYVPATDQNPVRSTA